MSQKVSHTQLEDCRLNPAEWVRRQKEAEQSGGIGYAGYVTNAVHRLHREGVAEARSRLADGLERNSRLTNADRIESALADFDAYVAWSLREDLTVVRTRVRIDYPGEGFLQMGGIVSRVDHVPLGMRAVLLGPFGEDWRAELRIPLLQDAIALRYGYPLNEVSIARQNLDGSNLGETRYEEPAVGEARREFGALSERVETLWGA